MVVVAVVEVVAVVVVVAAVVVVAVVVVVMAVVVVMVTLSLVVVRARMAPSGNASILSQPECSHKIEAYTLGGLDGVTYTSKSWLKHTLVASF